jgi:hypothetical protein
VQSIDAGWSGGAYMAIILTPHFSCQGNLQGRRMRRLTTQIPTMIEIVMMAKSAGTV